MANYKWQHHWTFAFGAAVVSASALGAPTAARCGMQGKIDLKPASVQQSIEACGNKFGPSATHGDWQMLASRNKTTQVWFHAPTEKITQISMPSADEVNVKVLKRAKTDTEVPSVEDMARDGLVKYVHKIVMSPS